jgi:hypothetical protein
LRHVDESEVVNDLTAYSVISLRNVLLQIENDLDYFGKRAQGKIDSEGQEIESLKRKPCKKYRRVVVYLSK